MMREPTRASQLSAGPTSLGPQPTLMLTGRGPHVIPVSGRRPHGTEDVPSRILQELTAQNLSARSLAHESTANREESGSAAAAAAAKRTPATKLAAHAGLLCADTYNLHAAMWARRDTEPQAAIFLQVTRLRHLTSLDVT